MTTYKPDLNDYMLQMIASMARDFSTGALTQIAGAAGTFALNLDRIVDDNMAGQRTAKAVAHEAAKFRALADACNAMIVLQTVDQNGEELTFNGLGLTGLTKTEILVRAKDLRRAMEARFGKGEGGTLQSAVDCVIDSAAERAQG